MLSLRSKVLALTAVTALLTVGTIAHPAPAQAADYPTWDQIQQAKNSAQQTKQEIAVVQGQLDQLNASAQDSASKARAAQDALATSQARLAYALASYLELDQRAEAARQEADASRQQAGHVVAAMYRGQGSTAGLSGAGIAAQVSGADVEDALSQYSALSWIGDRNQRTLAEAQAEQRTAQALSDQARAAEQELSEQTEALAGQVQSAQAAQQSAQAALAAQQEHASELAAQLGALQNQTSEMIAQRQAGIAAEIAAQKAAQAAAAERSRQQQAGIAQAANQSGGKPASSGNSSGGGSTTTWTPAAARATGQAMAAARGWSGANWTALLNLWNRESGWRVNAANPNSSAYGIPQALPGSKMASAGSDWKTNAVTQITWGLGYIAASYGTPSGAWAHSEATGWY